MRLVQYEHGAISILTYYIIINNINAAYEVILIIKSGIEYAYHVVSFPSNAE